MQLYDYKLIEENLIPARFSAADTILSILYYRLSLYFQPTHNVSSADSLWSLFNWILIGCSNDKTHTKHASFVFQQPLNYSLLLNRGFISLFSLLSFLHAAPLYSVFHLFGAAPLPQCACIYRTNTWRYGRCANDLCSVRGKNEFLSSAASQTLPLHRNPGINHYWQGIINTLLHVSPLL